MKITTSVKNKGKFPSATPIKKKNKKPLFKFSLGGRKSKKSEGFNLGFANAEDEKIAVLEMLYNRTYHEKNKRLPDQAINAMSDNLFIETVNYATDGTCEITWSKMSDLIMDKFCRALNY